MLPGDLKGSSDSFRRFSRSWADTEAERGMSWLEDGGLEESEETEGRGVEEELGLRTCTEDGVVSEGEDVSLSKHNTWNYTKRTNVKTKDSFFFPHHLAGRPPTRRAIFILRVQLGPEFFMGKRWFRVMSSASSRRLRGSVNVPNVHSCLSSFT